MLAKGGKIFLWNPFEAVPKSRGEVPNRESESVVLELQEQPDPLENIADFLKLKTKVADR